MAFGMLALSLVVVPVVLLVSILPAGLVGVDLVAWTPVELG
jgi:hypothetical protein